MKKADLVERVYQVHGGLTRREAARVVEAFTAAMVEGLANGGKIALHGFGSLNVQTRKGKTGVHPATGHPVEVKPRRTVSFRVSRSRWDGG